MIYFIQAGDRGHIKIGHIKDKKLNAFINRLKNIQTGNPQELNVLLIIPGNTTVERKIHRMFDNCRCEGGGGTEWFKPTSELLEFIKSFNPDMIRRVDKLERDIENTENRLFADIASKVFRKTSGGQSIKKTGKSKKKAEKTTKPTMQLKELIDVDIIGAPTKIVSRYKSENVKAVINEDGTITYRGTKYSSLSAAGSAARAFVNGVKNPSLSDFPTNGWIFWHIVDENGEQKALGGYRELL